MPYRDDDEDDTDEWDDDDVDVDDDSDDEPTVPCPFCKREILEDTPRCPHCERYLSEEDFARVAKPVWVVATAVVCLLIAIWLALTAF
jgi:hypothetical protein